MKFIVSKILSFFYYVFAIPSGLASIGLDKTCHNIIKTIKKIYFSLLGFYIFLFGSFKHKGPKQKNIMASTSIALIWIR